MTSSAKTVHIIGGGLAGSEAAWQLASSGVPVVLLRPADWSSCGLFRGPRIYGGSYNETEAYLYFCSAALAYLRATGTQPHVLHVHEWQAAAAAMLRWEIYGGDGGGMHRTRVALTIHNLDSTGECRQDEFAAAGVVLFFVLLIVCVHALSPLFSPPPDKKKTNKHKTKSKA